MKHTAARFMATVVVVALLAAACGSDGASDSATTTGAGGELGGSVIVSGSSTVEPITSNLLEKFRGTNTGVTVSVDGPGTGDGFQLFCQGDTDISDASRPIKEAEMEICAANGVAYVELQVAFDGISVLTSPANTAVSCLDFGDLYALLGPESLGFTRWSDADALASAVGGSHAPYPDADLRITAPGEESGTYDTFIELAIAGVADERGEDAVARPDYVSSANDNQIIEGIEGSETSLGWVGYAFYVNNRDLLKAIEIDGGDGCIAPTEATIADGTYPLSRPLFIYVNTAKAANKAEVAAFVDFYLSDEGLQAVTEEGYVRLPDYDAVRAAWSGR